MTSIASDSNTSAPVPAQSTGRLAVFGVVFLLLVLLLLAVGNWWHVFGLRAGPPGRNNVPFVISDIRVVNVSEESAEVVWQTDVPADSQVLWGKGNTRNHATPRHKDLVTEHRVTMTGLDSGTDYGITVISASKEGIVLSLQGPNFRTHGFSQLQDLCASPRGAVLANLPPMGTGLSWADFNNDGRLDVFLASEGLAGSRLMRNTPQGFEDATALSPNAFGGRGRQSAWCDYNGDGWPDLLVTGRAVALFTNNGPPEFTFTESSHLLPTLRSYDTEGAGWIDYNNDGKMDILVTNGKYGIFVFENMCNPEKPAFRDVSAQVGLGPNGFGAGFGDYITLGDYNGDGLTDFLYNLYTGILARNVGGRFEKADQAGITYLCTSTRKLGTAFGDFDNDGHTDIFVPQRGPSKLFRNKGDGTFEDVIAKCGIGTQDMDAVSATWGDINNDGYLDLFVGCEGTGNHLFLNNGDGTFRDVTAKFGLAGTGGRARGVTFVDYDNDGDLDLYVHNYQAPDYFYENNLVTTGNHTFLLVKFAPKRCPIGASVRLFTADNKLRGIRQISGGQGYGCQEPPMAHFGAAPGAYKVIVRYSNGSTAEKNITVDANGVNTLIFE